MLIQVNGSKPEATPRGATLGTVVASLRKTVSSDRKVLSEITVDGELLTPDREIEFSERPATDFTHLEAEAVEPAVLVNRIIVGILPALAQISEKSRSAAREIRKGKPAHDIVRQISEGMNFVVTVYHDGQRLLVATDSPLVLPRIALSAMETVLSEILASLQLDDPVRLSDALEHELVPSLEELESEIREWGGNHGSGSEKKDWS